jgi:glucosamine-6-phosphate deaminase
MNVPTAGSPPADVTVHAGTLAVRVYSHRQAMGRAAAHAVATRMQRLLTEREEIRMIFAAAPSQDDFIAALVATPGLDWGRVRAFHMDEYLGLPDGAPQRFGAYLRIRLFDRVPVKAVHYLDPAPAYADAECARYAALLREAPIDIVCLGIGENGHLAFNDPPVADFDDPALVKVVTLDEACRWQQVHDGAFSAPQNVPRQAMTLTIPALRAGTHLSVVVPGPRKAAAVQAALHGPVSTRCPASILRRHPDAVLYLDQDAATLLHPDQLA